MEDEDKEMCRNCKRDIPCSNYQMHTAHCARHITLCQKCDEPVPKREFENHRCQIETSPAPPPPQPPVTSVLQNIKEPTATHPEVVKAKHQEPQLVYDSICRFCELEFPQRDLQEHENYCGSRTEQCPECQDFVMLRDWEKHQSMRLYHELAKKPSSEVFKRENSRSSTSNLLQRSTSGLNISTSASSSSFYTAGKNVIANAAGAGQPFGDNRTPLQESKSMKNIANRKWSSIDYSDPLGSSYANASSNATSFDRRSREAARDSFRRPSDADSEVTKTWQRRSSSTDILSQAEEKWNTSVEEQLRLFARIEREKTKTTTTSSLISVDSPSSINVRQRSVSRQRKSSFSSSSRSNMNLGYEEQNDDAGRRQSRWDSSRMTMANAETSRSKSQNLSSRVARNHQQKSIVDRILGRKESVDDHEMEESDPSLPDLLPFSGIGASPVQHEKRHDRRTSVERNFVMTKNSRKASFVDRYLQKTETSSTASKTFHPLPTELPMAPEVPSRRRRGSMQRTQFQEPPTGNLIDIDTVVPPIKHERKRRTSGGLKRQQSLTRVNHDQASNDESVSDRRRKPSGSLQLRRQDSMTNLNRLQNEISLLQDTSLSTPTPYLSPTASSNLSSTNTGRSATYEAMATALLSEPPRRRFIDGIDNTENNRENLRDMLSKLRKDPMDDDLEKCDGEYFPCEFCGDPYPVEFIMRHQLSCDLNPTPIQEGNGFDYAEIARRAAANMALANSNG